jgi:hypothetical protein
MKKRKFAEGGMSDYAQAIAEGRDVVADPEDPSGSYARSMLGGASKPKQRIVSKKELEDSGLSLRDFLNKERGLTRRKTNSDAAYTDNSSRFPSSYEEAPVSRSGPRVGPTIERAAKMARDKAAEDEMMRPGRDAIEGVYPEAALLGGGLRGLMGRKGAAEAAGSAERGLVTSDTPLTFLGRSGAKNITPAEQIGMRQAPRIEAGAAKIERSDLGRLAKAEAKPLAPRQIAGSKAEEKSLTDEVLDILRGSNAKNRQMPKKEDFGGVKKPNRTRFNEDETGMEFKRGGKVKKYASGGSVSMASKRADGIAQKGKTKGKIC